MLELEHRAEVLAQLGRYAEAEELHRRALASTREDDSRRWLVQNNLAAVLHCAARYSEAEELYRECVRAGYVASVPNLGICLFDQGRHEEALPLLAPPLGDAWYRAACLSRLGRHAEAAAEFGALAAADRSPLNVYNWAVELGACGEDARLLYLEVLDNAAGDEEFVPHARAAVREAAEGVR